MPTFQVVPKIRKPLGYDRLWRRLTYPEGQNLLVTGATYRLSQFPTDEELATADTAYLGGHIYNVTDAVASQLSAAGFGAGLFSDGSTPPTFDGTYGSGPYGYGFYGTVSEGDAFGDGPYGDGEFG